VSDQKSTAVNPSQCEGRSCIGGSMFRVPDILAPLASKRRAAPWQAASVLLASAALLALAGCGAGGFAQDSQESDAFLDRVQTSCGKLYVGDQQIAWLLEGRSSNSTTFADVTTKLYSGQFSQSDYTDHINAFYDSGRSNQPALECIFSQI
jgi:hypothetical protein